MKRGSTTGKIKTNGATLPEYECGNCQWTWVGRHPGERPPRCPNCYERKNFYLRAEKDKRSIPLSYTCLKCSWKWTPRKPVGKPSRCPHCFSTTWELPRKPKISSIKPNHLK